MDSTTEPVVTQADRDAAADYMQTAGWCVDLRPVRAGTCDTPLVQAFARHRLAHSPAPVDGGEVELKALYSRWQTLHEAEQDVEAGKLESELNAWFWANIGRLAALRPEQADRGLVEALREALEPSGDTKAAYMGEFSFNLTRVDELGGEYAEKVYVPWTTIKEIMAAIRARAALAKLGEQP